MIPPIDPHLTAAEKPRLSRQCAAILARLQQGPASNTDLAALALKYTSRVSDIRAAGYAVAIIERDPKSGRVVYALKGDR